MTVAAGDGVSSWRDGTALHARFAEPFGIAVSTDGTIFVADAGDAQRIRAIGPDGSVQTLAGGPRGFADGVGGEARFNTPSALAIDRSGTLYVADTGNNAIRRVTRDGRVTTIAGDGEAGYRDGPGRVARFNGPVGVAIAPDGRLIVADTYNDRIRAIAPDGTVSTLAGSGEPGVADGSTTAALFDTPCGVAVDGMGRVLVADTGNGLVRVIDRAGYVTTQAPPPEGLAHPVGIAVSPDGTAYVTDDRGRIAEVTSTLGRVVAGSLPGFRDGPGADARFRRPMGMAFAAPGRLIVSDTGNSVVRLVAAPQRAELRRPASPFIDPAFDVEAFRHLPLLWPIAPMEGPHEIAGTIGEARGGEGSERFHAGIDVRAEAGTRVLAVRDGVVSSPISAGDFGSLNEWLRIGPVTYVHIRAGRARYGREDRVFDDERFVATYDAEGALVRVRVKRGARFRTGDAIATVNPFNHVHLNVGWPGEEHNPLSLRLAQFEDGIAPTIARRGIALFDEAGIKLIARQSGRLLVSGRVRIVADAWDRADGNRPNRRLGLYVLGYEVLHLDGSPVDGFETVRDTIRFDRLAWDPDAAHRVFAPGSGIPFYGRRATRFLYVVTNSFRDGVAREGYWDTSALAPGDYTLRVWAGDIAGNVTHRDVAVRRDF